MKNLSHYIVFWIIGQLPLFAQTNFPFPSADAVWSVSSKTQWWFDTYADNHKYTVMGDSILNGITYQKYYHCPDSILNLNNLSFYALLRQDEQTQRSYVLYPSEAVEHLLYDFSLQVGDTLSDPSYYLDWWWGEHLLTVTQVSFDDSGRKKIYLSQNQVGGGAAEEVWTEGIGSSKGLFNRTHQGLLDEPEAELLCFEQNEEIIYQKYPNICHYTSITAIETLTNMGGFALSPNPVNNVFTLHYQLLPNTLGSILKLYNAQGQAVLQQAVSPSNTQMDVSVAELPLGIYLCTLTTNKGEYCSQKVLINR